MADETEQTEDVSALRKAADEGTAARKEADLAKRELAFVKAGVDTDSKPAQALLNNYAGDLTAEAIKAEATEWGLLSASSADPATEPEPDYSEDAAQQALRDQINDPQIATNTPPEKNGIEVALDTFVEELGQGYSRTDATNRAFGRVIQAAGSGDKAAIFDAAAWRGEQAEAGHGANWAQ